MASAPLQSSSTSFCCRMPLKTKFRNVWHREILSSYGTRATGGRVPFLRFPISSPPNIVFVNLTEGCWWSS